MTIVEMVVAVFILGVVMSGMSLIIIDSLSLSRQNANRIVAANLATGELERLRSLDFTVLADMVADGDGDDTQGRVVDDRIFEVSRSMYWSANDAETGPCPGTIEAADENVLRIEVEVTWSRTMGVRPVRTDGWVAPPLGIYEISGGSLAVSVANHETPSQPVAGVSVVLWGPTDIAGAEQSRTAITDADGCAVFDDLTPGAYRSAIELAGYIDIDQRESTAPLPSNASTGVNQDGGVAVRSRSWMEFRYAPAGTLTVEAAGWAGGVLPTTALDWSVANTRGSFQRASVGTSSTVYPGDYELWAGTCPDADPGMVDPANDQTRIWPDAARGSSTSVDANGTHTATATIGTLDVAWDEEVLADPTRVVSLSATHQGPEDCSEGATLLELGTTTVGEGLRLALPFGDWLITATEVGQGQLGQRPILIDPRELAVVPEVVFDAPVVSDPDPPSCEAGPPSFVGSQSAALSVGTPNSVEVPIPSSTQVGDLLVLEGFITHFNNWAAPVGWTLVTRTQPETGSGNRRLVLLTKVAEAADLGQTVTLTKNQQNASGAFVVSAYRNAYGPAPITQPNGVTGTGLNDSYAYFEYGNHNAPTSHSHALYVLSAGSENSFDYLASPDYIAGWVNGAFNSDTPLSVVTLGRALEAGQVVGQSIIAWPQAVTGIGHLHVFAAGCEV